MISSEYLIKKSKHHLSTTHISSNALTVLKHLKQGGFEAYLVGGGVRDLLLGKTPKDFDVATNATPNEIKRLFRNARIIGKRFKLVHILYHREVIEVSTFRGTESQDDNQQLNDKGMLIRDNVFGTLENDAWRRDFTINSLYYEANEGHIIDYTGGYNDINSQILRIIGDPDIRYKEDPVRMLRAIRFLAKLKFKIDAETEKGITKFNFLISQISGSRLFEEMTKIFQCGESQLAFQSLKKYELLKYLFPTTDELILKDSSILDFIILALESTDTRILEKKPINPAFIYAIILWFPMLSRLAQLKEQAIPPAPALDQAIADTLNPQSNLIIIPKRHAQIIREIWQLQHRFHKRLGTKAQQLLLHPRFRAAYDFLALRALVGNESIELAKWWTAFQDLDEIGQEKMVAEITRSGKSKKKRRTKTV